MSLVKALARICGFGRHTLPQTPEEGARAAIAAYGLLQQSDIEGAQALLAPFLDDETDHADILFVQGLVHKQRNQHERAAACFHKAIALRHDFAAAWNQLGTVLKDSGRLEEALTALEKACDLEPQSAALHQNLGLLRYQLRNVDGAIQSLTHALSLDPSMKQAHFDLAEALLAAGDFERGWSEYEHRPHVARAMSGVRIPRWSPQRPPGRVAVIAEQGLGDVLLFLRFLPRLRTRVLELAVFVQPALVTLVRESGLADAVLSLKDIPATADYDSYLPLMSLAHVTGFSGTDLEGDAPYLAVGTERVLSWRDRMGPRDGRTRVGLVWGGNPDHPRDFDRSIPGRELAPLGRIGGIVWCNLQIGRDDLGMPAFPFLDFTKQLRDLADTAALIEQLDLVISVDTAVAHLAGALGRPTWVLCPLRADWRWEIAGRSSPWYSSARVFRPVRTSQWSPVVASLVTALEALVVPYR